VGANCFVTARRPDRHSSVHFSECSSILSHVGIRNSIIFIYEIQNFVSKTFQCNNVKWVLNFFFVSIIT